MPWLVCAAADQRDAQVVARVQVAALGPAIGAQDLAGAGVVAERHHHVGLQQPAVVFERLGQPVLDAGQRLRGLGHQAALVADLGEEVPGAIAHRRRRAAREQGLEHLGRLLVQAVGQQQAAAQHLGLVGVVRHALEVLRDLQLGDRREVAPLVELEQHVAVVRRLIGWSAGGAPGPSAGPRRRARSGHAASAIATAAAAARPKRREERGRERIVVTARL